jgi:hypothetical protein
MEMTRRNGLALKWTLGTGYDGDCKATGNLAHHTGITGRLLDVHVPGDGGDAEYLECIPRTEREQQRHGVIDSGIAVKENFLWGHSANRIDAYLGVADMRIPPRFHASARRRVGERPACSAQVIL